MNDFVSVNFQIVYNVLKNVKPKIRKQKLLLFLLYNTMILKQSWSNGDILIDYIWLVHY